MRGWKQLGLSRPLALMLCRLMRQTRRCAWKLGQVVALEIGIKNLSEICEIDPWCMRRDLVGLRGRGVIGLRSQIGFEARLFIDFSPLQLKLNKLDRQYND